MWEWVQIPFQTKSIVEAKKELFYFGKFISCDDYIFFLLIRSGQDPKSDQIMQVSM